MKRVSLHWAWIILAAGFLTVFLSYAIRYGYGILLPEMIRSLNITKTEAGIIASAYFITYAFFSPVFGILTDRIGGRKLVPLVCVTLGCGALLMSRSTSLLEASLSYALVGVGASGCWVPVVALVQRWFPVKRRGLTLGILSIGYAIAYGMMGLVLPTLVYGYGWRWSWHALGLAVLSLAVLNSFLLKNKPEDAGLKPLTSEAPFPTKLGYHEIIATKRFWLIGTSQLAVGTAELIVSTFLVTYANSELRIDYTTSGLLASVIGLGGIPGTFIFPAISDYIGRKTTIILCNAVGSFCLLALVIVGPNVHMIMIITAVFGLTNAGVWPAYAACAADYFSPTLAGTILGLWTTLYAMGTLTLPIAAGYIAEITQTFFWPFILASVLTAVAAMLLVPLEKPLD